jgi:hypothetical protein
VATVWLDALGFEMLQTDRDGNVPAQGGAAGIDGAALSETRPLR